MAFPFLEVVTIEASWFQFLDYEVVILVVNLVLAPMVSEWH